MSGVSRWASIVLTLVAFCCERVAFIADASGSRN
jgi:hypothetical protein